MWAIENKITNTHLDKYAFYESAIIFKKCSVELTDCIIHYLQL